MELILRIHFEILFIVNVDVCEIFRVHHWGVGREATDHDSLMQCLSKYVRTVSFIPMCWCVIGQQT
jgi:hypothetical protein